MPKIKDLGINIVPGTMRPPEIGGGGWCRFSVRNCIDLSEPQTSNCNCISDQCRPHSQRMYGGRVDPQTSNCNCISDQCAPHSRRMAYGPTHEFCSNCDCVSAQCGPNTSRGVRRPMDQSVPPDCEPVPTVEGCSNCNCVSDMVPPCTPCTMVTPRNSNCNCVTDDPMSNMCDCITDPVLTPQCCRAMTRGTLVTPQTPNLAPGTLSRDDIATLRAQLREALANLDIAEKNMLPNTIEGVDAREQEIQRELEALKARRDELSKKE